MAGVGTWMSLRPLPTETIPWFHDSVPVNVHPGPCENAVGRNFSVVIWIGFGWQPEPSAAPVRVSVWFLGGILAQLRHALSNQSFYTVGRVPGTFWDVQGAAVHFPNTSEQQRESSRKRVSGGGENYTWTHQPGQQSLWCSKGPSLLNFISCLCSE